MGLSIAMSKYTDIDRVSTVLPTPIGDCAMCENLRAKEYLLDRSLMARWRRSVQGRAWVKSQLMKERK